MIFRSLQLVLSILLFFQPKHFHAYEVTSAGMNIIVDPKSAQYTKCKVDVLFKSDQILFGQQSYHIYGSQPFGDSLKAFFCYQLRGRDSVFCSITPMPAEDRSHWYLLIAWEDSTKAYKATEVVK